MTPQEKAFHLYFSFIRDVTSDTERAKIAALKVVDEIIQAMDNVMLPNPFKQYWNKVKQEIQAL